MCFVPDFQLKEIILNCMEIIKPTVTISVRTLKPCTLN